MAWGIEQFGGRKDVVVVIIIRGCLGLWNAGSNLRGGRQTGSG